MIFDIRTLILINFIVNIITMVTMIIIWHQYRRRFEGISFWLINNILHAVGVGLILLRGFIPDFIAIVISNTMLLSGALFTLMGLEHFADKKGPQIHNYILMILYFLLTTYFFAINPDMAMREIVMSSMIIIIDSQSCWLLLRRVSHDLRSMTNIVCMVMSGYVIASFIRMILLMAFPLQTEDFFKSGFADSMAITVYLSLHICLIISLVLIVTRRLLAEVQAQEEKFTKAFHSSPYAIVLTRSSDGQIFEVNDGFVNITGYQRDEVIGKTTLNLHLFQREDDRINIVNELSKKRKIKEYEIQILKKSGEMMIGLFSADFILINNDQCILSSISDITEQSKMRNKLQEMATHDVLTGLPNRRFFYDRFEIALANAQRGDRKMAIMSIDLDKFKPVNDTLGHAAGDMVLIEAAQRLRGSLRKVDTVARFGGDEFLLLIWETESKDGVTRVAQKILDSFRQPFFINRDQINLSVSIGIALYPEHGEDIQTLIRKSDEALYLTKERGRNGYTIYQCYDLQLPLLKPIVSYTEPV